MNPILARAGCAANTVVARVIKRPCSTCSSVRARFTPKSCLTAVKPHCKPSFAVVSRLNRWTIAMAGAATGALWAGGWWMSVMPSTCVQHLRVEHGNNEFGFGSRPPPKGHPMALKAFGISPNEACKSSTVCRLIRFICISKECEWRSNQRNANLYLLLLKVLREKSIWSLYTHL